MITRTCRTLLCACVAGLAKLSELPQRQLLKRSSRSDECFRVEVNFCNFPVHLAGQSVQAQTAAAVTSDRWIIDYKNVRVPVDELRARAEGCSVRLECMPG